MNHFGHSPGPNLSSENIPEAIATDNTAPTVTRACKQVHDKVARDAGGHGQIPH